MKILGIETSCDETAVCLLDCRGSIKNNNLKIKVLGDALYSQISSHQQFGGVVPMMAKREHAKNLIPLFLKVIKEAGLQNLRSSTPKEFQELSSLNQLDEIFGREIEFKKEFLEMVQQLPLPPSSTEEGTGMSMVPIDIDAIAVTEGPGLEPALWMGIIFAKALSLVLNIPIIPVNHLEGHIISALALSEDNKIYKATQEIKFPIISLLISGGHTELVLSKWWNDYEIIGQTRDDAVGEAFDKVARMLDLPYPGGPKISMFAEEERRKWKNKTTTPEYILPRPMIKSKDFDFSFSGLKTAVLYSLKNNEIEKGIVAKEFEEAISEVLISKTLRAVENFNAKTLIVAGGVVSNNYLREKFEEEAEKMPEVNLFIPNKKIRTDNAVMIGMAGYEKAKNQICDFTSAQMRNGLKAKGTLQL